MDQQNIYLLFKYSNKTESAEDPYSRLSMAAE